MLWLRRFGSSSCLARQRNSLMAAVAAARAPGWGATPRADVKVRSGGSRKTTERVTTKLQRSRQDVQALGGAVRKLSNHSKATQIDILQHLLDEKDWELALPVYKEVRKRDWYEWNPILHARLLALLTMTKQTHEAQLLISDTPGDLNVRDEMKLQVYLIENFAKFGLLDEALTIFQGLQSHLLPSAGPLSYRALMRGYISLNLPHQAHLTLSDMKSKGFRPCLDDYKALIHAFGSGGHLADMEKLVCELNGVDLKLDLSGYNMMLSAYGQAKNFKAVTEILERMQGFNISCSINSRNAISKFCPTLVSFFEELEEIPGNAESLYRSLKFRGISDGELEATKELMNLGIPPESVQCSPTVWELNLHHMFLGTANIALFLWLHLLKAQCNSGVNFPLRVAVVTGWGKHSDSEGRSVLKERVIQLLSRVKSPFKPDSHNQGVISCGGNPIKIWLTDSLTSPALE